MLPFNLKLPAIAIIALSLAFAAISAQLRHVTDQRDDLRMAVSTAAHASDKQGRPVILSTSAAIEQVRILGKTVDEIRLATANAKAADATHTLTVERNDARTTQEVSKHVQGQLAHVQDELAASRALADERLRQLRAARANQGGSGDPAVAEDPDAVCRAYFDASCEEVLALLAEAEANTVKLLGWQKWWAEVQANHDGPPAAEGRSTG